MKLEKQMVAKPWGRDDIAPAFGAPTEERIGEIWYDSGEAALPLLVKWLFTSEKLSIQVHPDDAQAKARGMPSGKEECWYIVDAQPGAVIGIGTRIPLDDQTLRTASLSGGIEDLIDWKPVKAGDYFYIPAGTVHAIGTGVTLVEVQQYADITYRLYDYGRLDNGKLRQLHLDDGVAVADARPYSDARSGNAPSSQQLADGPHFRLWIVDSQAAFAQLPEAAMRWIIPLAGQVTASAEIAAVGDCLYVDGDASVQLDSEARLLVAAV